jgi:hypothetical protein
MVDTVCYSEGGKCGGRKGNEVIVGEGEVRGREWMKKDRKYSWGENKGL